MKNPQQSKQPAFPLWWLWIGLLLVAVVGLYSGGGAGRYQSIPYSQFQQLLDQSKVKQVVVSGDTITGQLKEPLPGSKSKDTSFTTTSVAPDLAGALSKHGVEYTGAATNSGWGTLLSWIIPPLIFVGIWFFAIRGFSGGGAGGLGSGLMSIGRSKAKLAAETGIKTTFDDVAGVDEAKEELHEIVDFLKRPEEFSRLGAHIPRGILLIGPPGTGKTLLARAVAGEAGVALLLHQRRRVRGDVRGRRRGARARHVREARKQAPCIIFIDELDALGRARNASPDDRVRTRRNRRSTSCWRRWTGSTAPWRSSCWPRPTGRRSWIPALLRAGRFDRQVLVDRPDKKGRIEILRIHLEPLKSHRT